jgi:hypothetical protein
MPRFTPTRSLATLAVMAGLLVAAAPAAATPMLHGDFATSAANAQTKAGMDYIILIDGFQGGCGGASTRERATSAADTLQNCMVSG